MNKKKQRDSNLELYRIILMLGIIAHHYVGNSGLMDIIKYDPLTIKSCFYYFIGMWGKIGINCFVLISGYFMCKSNMSVRKLFKLVFELEFYIISIFAVFFLCGYSGLTLSDIIKTQVSCFGVLDGFISCFIYFYILIPFLNVLIKNINQKQHLSLIGICTFIYVIVGTIPIIPFRMNYIEWFVVLYFISSYLRLYGIPEYSWGGLFVLSIVAAVSSVIVTAYFFYGTSVYESHFGKLINFFVYDCNKILGVFVSISSFVFFVKLKISYNRYVNKIATSILGVLLIHAHSQTMRHWLWGDFVNVTSQYHSRYYYLLAISTIVGIFITCVVIDQIRIYFVERPVLLWLDNRYKDSKLWNKGIMIS